MIQVEQEGAGDHISAEIESPIMTGAKQCFSIAFVYNGTGQVGADSIKCLVFSVTGVD